MNIKTTSKYFSQKNTIMYIGFGVAAVGVVFMMIGHFMMYVGFGTLVVAAAMVFISLESKIKGSEMNEECEKELVDFSKEALKKYYLDYEKADFISFFEYDYENLDENEKMVKGNDGTYRPRHVLAHLVFVAGKNIYICKERFSLVDENDKTKEDMVIEIEGLKEIKNEEYKIETKEGVLGRYHTLEIVDENDKTIIKMPYPLNETIFEKVELINRLIRTTNLQRNN